MTTPTQSSEKDKPEHADEALLVVNGLKMYFYTMGGVAKAVDKISLTVPKKKVVGLVGESGCGKTMTAMSIMRLVPKPGKIIGGEIEYKGRNLLELSEKEMRNVRGKEISMVFQDPMTFLNPVMRIEKQITDSIRTHEKIRRKAALRKAIEMLTLVNLPAPEKVAKYYPHQLSGGMRQRVLIASALSCNPSLIIADEPTTALDVTVQMQILELIKNIVKERGMSMLLITHDLGIVAELCDEVYIMYAGKIVEHANVAEIFDDPQHPYTAGLLECVLSIDEFKKDLVSIEGYVPSLINPPSGCRFHPRCKKSMAICQEKEPPTYVTGSNHKVACWLYGGLNGVN